MRDEMFMIQFGHKIYRAVIASHFGQFHRGSFALVSST